MVGALKILKYVAMHNMRRLGLFTNGYLKKTAPNGPQMSKKTLTKFSQPVLTPATQQTLGTQFTKKISIFS